MFMKRYAFLFLTTLAIFLYSLPATAAAAQNQAAFVVGRNDYSVNGAVYRMDAAPFIERERVFVPLRYLAYALGIGEQSVVWDIYSKTIELHADEKIIKLTLNNQTISINNKNYQTDTSPILRNGRLFLPARWVAEALGYATGWDNKIQAVLIGPPGNLPDAGSLPPVLTEIKIRPCEFKEDSLYIEKELSSSAIFFPYSAGEQANVYNAGVAARILNGLVLAPGQEFSFNRAVGERTAQKGFITGVDAGGNLTTGGGVCRTSTVIFQAAKKAGLQITERHPHSPPVNYTPPGTDATVDWNRLDLKFINSRPFPIVIYSGITEEEKGRNLRAALFERRPLQKIKVAVLKETPQENLWESIEDYQLDSLVMDSRAYVSIEQLSDLFRFTYEVKEENGINKAAINFNGQSIILLEKDKKAIINGTPFTLSGEPFALTKSNCRFWLVLKDWAKLAGAEVLWVDRSPPLILFNLSGVSVAGRQELKADWKVTGQVKPYGYRELKKDLQVMTRLYPQIRVASIGVSVYGREIPVVSLGSGPKEVFASAAWHAEEWITACFLMHFLEGASSKIDTPELNQIFKNITLHIAPMINPDGCEIAVHGSELPPPLATAVSSIAPPDFDLRKWRANARGIDLNNQFPVRWEVSRSRLRNNPLPWGRAGEEPLCAPESKAVYDFTLKHDLQAVFCYHSQGEVLYWRSLDGVVTPAMRHITDTYARESGYVPLDTVNLSGGYRDWFVTSFHRPGITVEVGKGVNPLPLAQFETIWRKNSRAFYECLKILGGQTA